MCAWPFLTDRRKRSRNGELTGRADLNTTGMSFYGSATVPDDELQYFGDTTTESGVWSQNSPNSNVTYVQGPNTGFAFNFSGEQAGFAS